MRLRKLLGLFLTTFGLALVAIFLNASMFRTMLPVSSVLLIVLAVILLAVGLPVLVTKMFERWLDRSQTALVDGLQAG
jgi:cell division protein FtsW (lipid II flippase)